MEVINAPQGSEEWQAVRTRYCCASDAPAMLGVSTKVQRNELLHMRATCGTREFSEWAQKNLLDKGHDIEALARPIVEAQIAEDLAPVTGWTEVDGLKLLASFDGLTAGDDLVWENKLFNRDLAKAVTEGELPAEYWAQLEHQLIVSGADAVHFTVSDGTEANTLSMVYRSVPERRAQIIAGWKQFLADLAAYKPVDVIPAAVAQPTLALPVPSIQINGQLALITNLDVFGARLKAFTDGINKNPETDQDFANLESAIKVLKEAEAALTAAEDMGMAQVASVEEMRRTVKLYRDQARENRLNAERLVKAEKENVRTRIHFQAKTALEAHVAQLNERLGRPLMPPQVADFATAMKAKKTLASLRNAVDTELARAKIAASATADLIQININTMRELAEGYAALFPDVAQVLLKPKEDCRNLIKARIAEHKAAEEKRLEAERARIRAEEEARAAAAQKAKEEAERIAREAQERAKAEAEALERRQREEKEARERRQREEAEAAERARLQAELDAERSARAAAEARTKLADIPTTAGAQAVFIPDPVGKPPTKQPTQLSILDRPTDDEMIEALSVWSGTTAAVVIGWLRTIDLDAAARRLLQTA